MWGKYRSKIKKSLLKFLNSKVKKFSDFNKHADLAVSKFRDSVGKGKLIRGSLVLWSNKSFGGKNSESALLAATAIELFHTSLLIHDDVMDEDFLRRGSPSVYGQYLKEAKRYIKGGKKEYGANMAFCVGDLGYFWAIELLSQAQSHLGRKNRLGSLVSDELAKVALAQMTDVHNGFLSSVEPSEQEILDLYRCKTARYTFSMPLMAGALISDASSEVIVSLENMGEYLGVAFQIKDDELCLLGDEKITGKSTGSDVRSNKKTLHRKMLFERAAKKDRNKLLSIFGKQEVTEADLKLANSMLLKYKVINDLRIEAAMYIGKANAVLSTVQLSQENRAAMESLIKAIEERHK